ncbi:MAG: hypothetical protein WCF69_09730 [Mycobacterium sp.]
MVLTRPAAATPTAAAIPMCTALDWSWRRMEGIRITPAKHKVSRTPARCFTVLPSIPRAEFSAVLAN